MNKKSNQSRYTRVIIYAPFSKAEKMMTPQSVKKRGRGVMFCQSGVILRIIKLLAVLQIAERQIVVICHFLPSPPACILSGKETKIKLVFMKDEVFISYNLFWY